MEIPDLSIPIPEHATNSGGETLRNLSRFLFVGASSNRADAFQKIMENDLQGEPQFDRLPLLKAIQTELKDRVTMGQSAKSVPTYINHITQFIRFLETTNCSFQLNELERNYFAFAKFLEQKALNPNIKFSEKSAYIVGATLSSVIGSILGIPDAARLRDRTNLRFPHSPLRAVSRSSEKKSLESTFKMGAFLLDLIEGLTVDKIYGSLPIVVSIRNGKQSEIQLDGWKRPKWLNEPSANWTTYQRHRSKKTQLFRNSSSNVTGEGSNHRWTFVNLRIQAEFLMFIAQTGMNSGQAKEMGRKDIKYKPHGEGWVVRGYKNRKGGEVSFEIYSSYKSYFDNYRSFIQHFFPNSEYLFPQFNHNGVEESKTRYGLAGFETIKDLLTEFEIPWIPPRNIRNTRVNWILRRSGDEEQTAELAQHTVEVLKGKYARPSLQRTIIETTRFWNRNDPIKKSKLKESVVGSLCNGDPEALSSKPDTVASPNCTNPSGCLWCTHHRDIDSQDYVWSLVSLRHLKTIEAGYFYLRDTSPAKLVLNRLTEKINWFQASSDTRSEWVEEAITRISEKDFHPHWAPFINFIYSV